MLDILIIFAIILCGTATLAVLFFLFEKIRGEIRWYKIRKRRIIQPGYIPFQDIMLGNTDRDLDGIMIGEAISPEDIEKLEALPDEDAYALG